MPKTAITPTRKENYPEWYQQVIRAADLAENSVVHGCMVIKPWGYAIWENMQKVLDEKIKETGHENLYFPLLIPVSFLEKEAAHIEGFAKECAVITHHRLKAQDGKLIPASPLEEPLVVRPTSETIVGDAFSRWIQSYRDLPLKINQWANIVRWEMRTRLFLRTTEFLWQEGHTAHTTREEAEKETFDMLNVYADFAKNYMAMPVIPGEKTQNEKFPGAEASYTIEAMMQDKKALQSGTSHFLGQNFAKAFDIQYLNEKSEQAYAWTSSWGVSTRLIGGLIMSHSDDDGLVLPPKLAPLHVIILPLYHKYNNPSAILDYCFVLEKVLKDLNYNGAPLRVKVDTRESRPGDKAWGWVKKGVPIRLEVGPKEFESGAVFMGRRDKSYQERASVSKEEFVKTVLMQLDEIQHNLYERAEKRLKENTVHLDSEKAFYHYFKKDGGFAYAYWHEDNAVEQKIKEELKVTARCMPLADKDKRGKCIFSGKEGALLTVFAKAY